MFSCHKVANNSFSLTLLLLLTKLCLLTISVSNMREKTISGMMAASISDIKANKQKGVTGIAMGKPLPVSDYSRQIYKLTL